MIEADGETLRHAEEDLYDPEQDEIPKNTEPALPFTRLDKAAGQPLPY